MDGLTYLLFSGGDLAGFGALGGGHGAAEPVAQAIALLSGESDGRLEIWRGEELVTVVGVHPAPHEGGW